jgi:PAS domain S-box-containing protein
VKWYGANADIDDYKRTEESLRLSEERFRQLADSMPQIVWTAHPDGALDYYNARWFDYTGMTLEQTQGWGWGPVLHPDDLQLCTDRWTNAFTTGESYEIKYRFKRASDGSYRWHLGRALPVRDEHGKITKWFGTCTDIEDEVRSQEAIHRLNEELERRVEDRTAQLSVANRELEAFSYSVAHDLRAPLRGMSGFANVLVDDYGDKLDAGGLDCLQEIKANAKKMAHLIDALLSLSRLTRSEMRPERVDLTSLAKKVARELAVAEPERQVEVVIENGLEGELDPELARALVENLLGNAWKFTKSAPAARVEFGTVDDGDSRAFFVRDNGAGFDMAYADKLFAPFQRLHSAAEYPGTGVGLATVQRIVHRHGGRIRAEGRVGGGAIFQFTLPRLSRG